MVRRMCPSASQRASLFFLAAGAAVRGASKPRHLHELVADRRARWHSNHSTCQPRARRELKQRRHLEPFQPYSYATFLSMEGRDTYLDSKSAKLQKIRNQHKMHRARQPAKKCVPSHRLSAFLGALLLVSTAINNTGDGKTNSMLVSATVSSSSMSFFGKRSSSKGKIGTAAASATTSIISTTTQTPLKASLRLDDSNRQTKTYPPTQKPFQ